jgi:hypothetical protein
MGVGGEVATIEESVCERVEEAFRTDWCAPLKDADGSTGDPTADGLDDQSVPSSETVSLSRSSRSSPTLELLDRGRCSDSLRSPSLGDLTLAAGPSAVAPLKIASLVTRGEAARCSRISPG